MLGGQVWTVFSLSVNVLQTILVSNLGGQIWTVFSSYVLRYSYCTPLSTTVTLPSQSGLRDEPGANRRIAYRAWDEQCRSPPPDTHALASLFPCTAPPGHGLNGRTQRFHCLIRVLLLVCSRSFFCSPTSPPQPAPPQGTAWRSLRLSTPLVNPCFEVDRACL